MKRSGKFYSKNEKETLRKLGLRPIPFSGAGWIEKEDGENENVLVQLKSTEASSYRVDILDIKKLEYHSSVSNKIPVFIIQFLKHDKIYALVNLEDLEELNEALNGKRKQRTIKLKQEEVEEFVQRRKIQSSPKARDKFFEEREKFYGKRKRD